MLPHAPYVQTPVGSAETGRYADHEGIQRMSQSSTVVHSRTFGPIWRLIAGACMVARALLLTGMFLGLTTTAAGAQVAPAGSGAAPAPAQVPGAARTIRIGVLTLGTLEALEPGWDFFVRRLAELGYVEGKNLIFDRRAASSDTAQLPALAAGLVAQSPDVIFAAFTPAVLAVRNETHGIPIVIPFGGDPVGSGLVQSFDHPGGNVTGMSDPSSQLMPKLMRVLIETLPGRHRLAVLTPPDNPAVEPGLQASRAVAESLGTQIFRFDVAAPSNDALDAAFDAALGQGAEGFVYYYSPTTAALDQHAAEAAARRHLPGVYETRGPVDDGGLMSLTVDYNASFARAADYVAQILDGADPADLPVGVPETFDLVINLPSAQALGVTFPPDVLSQATELIR
jgi:putative tryptophan/tyrosine transport system substrate-binding protein